MKMYDDGVTQLHRGDIRDQDQLDVLDALDIRVVLTDPPYAANKYLSETERSGGLSVLADAQWSGSVFEWVAQWWWPVRQRLHEDAVAWVFCNVHYMGFYLRWSKYSHFPLRGIFGAGPDEFLLAFGADAMTPDEGAVIHHALTLNTYGANKSVEMLRAILQVSPPGLVLDPFVGLGSTLMAARAEGRPSCGFEIKDHIAEPCAAKLRGE